MVSSKIRAEKQLEKNNEFLEVPYIEFFTLVDTIPFQFGRKKLLRLSRSLGDYSHIYIVWNPKTKKIAGFDMEHEELLDLSTFEDFTKNLEKYMNQIIAPLRLKP